MQFYVIIASILFLVLVKMSFSLRMRSIKYNSRILISIEQNILHTYTIDERLLLHTHKLRYVCIRV